MSDTIDTIDYKGYNIELMLDDSPENPLDWATPKERGIYYAMKHSRYNLPYEVEADTDDFNSWSELAAAVTAKDGELPGYNFRFIRWYEHSGIVVSLRDDEGGQEWDAGIAGVMFGETTDYINSNFLDYKAYIEGDVYGFNITDANGDDIDDGNLWGLYGYDYAIERAKSDIDDYIERKPSERAKHVAPEASRYHR